MSKRGAAIVGSGNIGTDLLVKMLRSERLEPLVVAGIDPDSDGLERARSLGVATTHEGLGGLMAHERFDEIEVVFDATSAKAHERHAPMLREAGRLAVDLTPAAVGPYVVPAANLDEVGDEPNLNLVTCGGQATIPIVWAIARSAPIAWAEIVASIASASAGPGTRANIDEFTETTARAVESVGGAERGKAIIILNPADPPLIMRDTVFAICRDADARAVREAVREVARRVAEYVPGYRLVADALVEPWRGTLPGGERIDGQKVSVFVEVEGAGDYLPKYAGNLDIMTAAALRVGERAGGAQ